MTIKVLGSGCANCKRLFENTKEAVESLNADIEIKYITDLKEIIASGVMSMPALLINDKVVSMGKVITPTEIIKIIQKNS